jgi:dTDP-glucose 4,6-dehydratase
MKNLLVTGGCGFMGSNFIRYLLTESDFSGHIINLDALTYAGNLENLAGIDDKFSDRYIFIQADICNPKELGNVFDKYHIDSICHFAAETHVDRSIRGPSEFIRTNIEGTFNLLESARSHQEKINLFHYISTDEVYGSLGDEGYFKEDTPYDPSSPYSASKAASDHLVNAYHKTYQLPVTISNCTNNYGPYQFPEKLIPLMILNAIEGKPLPVYGKGNNIRDWIYVKDHSKAVWTIMKKGKRGSKYNIGGKNEMRNIDVVEMICDSIDNLGLKKEFAPRRNLISFVEDRMGHDFRYAMDFAKLENELGWAPEESFETGLKKTIDWYLGNTDWVARVKSGEYRKWIKEHYGE